jgi:hypothetical protein
MMVYPLHVQFVAMKFVPKLLIVEMVNMVETTLVLCFETQISRYIVPVVVLDFQAMEPTVQYDLQTVVFFSQPTMGVELL